MKRSHKPADPENPLPTGRITVQCVLVSVLVYGALVGSTFAPDVRKVFEKAFGESPLGMPNSVFVTLFLSISYLPFPRVFWHASAITTQAYRDGVFLGQVNLFRYLWRVGERHPGLKRSRKIVTLGLVYAILLMTGWIVYASIRGI